MYNSVHRIIGGGCEEPVRLAPSRGVFGLKVAARPTFLQGKSSDPPPPGWLEPRAITNQLLIAAFNPIWFPMRLHFTTRVRFNRLDFEHKYYEWVLVII